MVTKQFIIAVFLFGVACGQLENDPAVDKALNNLPPELQGKVDKDQVEELKNKSTAVFKEKCEKNGGAAAFDNAEKALQNLKTCMEDLVDREVLENEIEEAKPNGRIDEVFKKYCAKKPQFKSCFKDAVDAVKPCFTIPEQKNLKTINNITEQLAEFICFKDGDRIALFIAEGGPECLQDQQDAIQACVNSTMGSAVNFDSNNITADSLPEINFGASECNKLSALQTCVVGKLEACAQPTTANIVESLFKFIRKGTPCKEFNENVASPRNANTNTNTNDPASQKSKPGAASGLVVTSLTFVMAIALSLVI